MYSLTADLLLTQLRQFVTALFKLKFELNHGIISKWDVEDAVPYKDITETFPLRRAEKPQRYILQVLPKGGCTNLTRWRPYQ